MVHLNLLCFALKVKDVQFCGSFITQISEKKFFEKIVEEVN